MAAIASRTGDAVRARRGPILASPYLLLLPAAIALAAVSIYPLFYGVRASFTHYLYGRDVGFAGLDQLPRRLERHVLPQRDGTTAKYVVCAVTIETLLGLGLALLVSRELRFAGPIRVGLILPMTIAPVVVGVMWRLIYDSGVGVVDPFFELFGFSPPRRAGPQHERVHRRRAGRRLGVDAADVPDHPGRPAVAAAGAARGGARRRRRAAAAVLRPHAADAACRCCWSRSCCARSTPSARSTRSTC